MSNYENILWFAVYDKTDPAADCWKLMSFYKKIPEEYKDKDHYDIIQCKEPEFKLLELVYLPTKWWYESARINEVKPLVTRVNGKLKITRIGYWIYGPDINQPHLDFFRSPLEAILSAWHTQYREIKYFITERLKRN